MKDLAEFITLPFLAAFDVPSTNPTNMNPQKSAQKRVTYIALSKKTMPKLVDLYLQLKTEAAIYTDGTVESIISVRALLLLDRDWK
jgi:hypothetical protein